LDELWGWRRRTEGEATDDDPLFLPLLDEGFCSLVDDRIFSLAVACHLARFLSFS